MNDLGLTFLVLIKGRSSGGNVRQSLWTTNQREAKGSSGAESCTFRLSEHQSSKRLTGWQWRCHHPCRSKGTLRDAYASFFSHQTTEPVTGNSPKDLGFPWETHTWKEEDLRSGAHWGRTCLSGRDFTKCWPLVGQVRSQVPRQEGSLVRTIPGPGLLSHHFSCLLFNPKCHANTPAGEAVTEPLCSSSHCGHKE